MACDRKTRETVSGKKVINFNMDAPIHEAIMRLKKEGHRGIADQINMMLGDWLLQNDPIYFKEVTAPVENI